MPPAVSVIAVNGLQVIMFGPAVTSGTGKTVRTMVSEPEQLF